MFVHTYSIGNPLRHLREMFVSRGRRVDHCLQRSIESSKQLSVLPLLDAASETPLTSETEPALVGYGWEVMQPNGLPIDTGSIADTIQMNSKTGEFTVTNLKLDKQLLLRMTALFDVKLPPNEGEENGATVRRRYVSQAIPFVAEGSNWHEQTRMDCKQIFYCLNQ